MQVLFNAEVEGVVGFEVYRDAEEGAYFFDWEEAAACFFGF